MYARLDRTAHAHFWRSAFLALLAVIVVVFVLLAASCGAAQQRDDPTAPEAGEAASYFWLPALLGERVEVRDTSPALIQCYHDEIERRDDPMDFVSVELEVIEGRLRVRSAPLSQRFGACIEGVTVTWNLAPDDFGEGDLFPLTFGRGER